MESGITAWERARKIFNKIHLWLGIGSGLILFTICLTGTIYVFNVEVQEILRRDKYFVEVPVGAERIPVEQAVALTMEKIGEGTVQHVTVPAYASRVYRINVRKELPATGSDGKPFKKPDTGIYADRGMNFLVNPYSGEILGANEGRLFYFFRSVYKLHRWLLMETKIGRPIVGVATIIFVFMILSGWIIWLPREMKKWKRGFKIKFNGSRKRLFHDLHATLGFYASFFLLIMALTGLTWSFPWYKDGFFKVLGVENKPSGAGEAKLLSGVPEEGHTGLSIAELLALSDRLLPYSGDHRFGWSSDPVSSLTVSKSKVGFFSIAGIDRLHFDRHTGQLLGQELFADKPLNEKITSSIKAIHIGEIFGKFSKVLYFVVCLLATSFPITGSVVWYNKLKRKDKTSAG